MGSAAHRRRWPPGASWLRRLRLPAQPLARHLILALCGAAVLYLITSSLSPYNDFEVGEIALYVIALAGLSLLTGVNGQFSLGHGAFMAVGAYTTALLMTHTHLNFVVELLAAVGGAAVLGLLIGIPATRLKGPYLAGMTLLLALALPPIADKWSTTFGGDQGLSTTVPTAPGTLNPEEWLAWIQIAGALIVLVLLANLLRSRYGRNFRAVRDDEIAASLAGIHVARTKVMAFVVERGVCRAGRGLPGAVDGGREHRGVPPDPLHPVAGGHGARRHRHPHGHVVGSRSPRVPAPVVDISVGRFQPGERRQRLPGHHHLRPRAHRGHDRRPHRHPGRPPVGVALDLDRGLGSGPAWPPNA